MIEIAIDSSQNCSMALACNDGIFQLDNLNFGRDSDSLFLPCLENFLGEHDLDVTKVEAWTVGLGPGSFAGIRFALALVKGICTASGAKARGIPSSFAMAKALNKKGKIAVLQNARCGKLFISLYNSDAACKPEGLPRMVDLNGDWKLTEAVDVYCTPDLELLPQLPEQLQNNVITIPPPKAVFLLGANEERWKWLNRPDLEPLYVRPPA